MRPEIASIAGVPATSFLVIGVLLLLGRGKRHNAAQGQTVDPVHTGSEQRLLIPRHRASLGGCRPGEPRLKMVGANVGISAKADLDKSSLIFKATYPYTV